MLAVFINARTPAGDRVHSQQTGLTDYLGERQAVLILVFVLHLKVIQSLALGWGLGQGLDALDVAGRQEAVAAVQLSVVPVLVHLAAQDDDVTLVELEVTRFLALVAVESFPTRQLGNILERQKKKTMSKYGP